MEYRIKYVFNNSRDKGQELYDWYGEYKIYDLVQEGCCENPEFVEYKVPKKFKAPETVYEFGFNQKNSEARQQAGEDTEHNVLPMIESEKFNPEKFSITGGEWVTKEHKRKTDEEKTKEECETSKMVGTGLAEFLNFNIDEFIKGYYVLLWKYDTEKEVEVIAGWKSEAGHDLNDLGVRNRLSLEMTYGSESADNIPFFIRMFGCKFINTDTWEYDMKEVENIKALQKRIRVFCEKVFFPVDENDKRTNFERYCANVENIEKKEFRKRVPKDWITPASLEHALANECYAMIKGNVNFFQCGNCGLYTVMNDSRSRLCDRRIYDGEVFKDGKRHEYYYVCKEEQYYRTTRDKIEDNIISVISDHEKKRLNHHITRYPDLEEVHNRLVYEFGNLVEEYEPKCKVMVEKADDEGMVLRIANDYLSLIVEKMNQAIKECLGSGMKKIFLFDRKKNAVVTSLEGNIFG